MIILFWICVAALAVIDRLTKSLAVNAISEGEIIHLLAFGDTDILSFTMHRNTGAAFSSFTGKTGMLIAVTIIAIAAMVVYFHKEKHKHLLMTLSFALVVGGGIGNLIDRCTQMYVVDFICLFPFTFVFNAADVFVVVGAVLLVAYYLFFDEKYKKRFAADNAALSDGEAENGDENAEG